MYTDRIYIQRGTVFEPFSSTSSKTGPRETCQGRASGREPKLSHLLFYCLMPDNFTCQGEPLGGKGLRHFCDNFYQGYKLILNLKPRMKHCMLLSVEPKSIFCKECLAGQSTLYKLKLHTSSLSV